eukprot:31154-Eustigmatos_ZCMA.PRE.1
MRSDSADTAKTRRVGAVRAAIATKQRCDSTAAQTASTRYMFTAAMRTRCLSTNAADVSDRGTVASTELKPE